MPRSWGLDGTAEGVRAYGESDLAAAALEPDDGKDVIVQSSRHVFKLLHLSGLADDSLPNVEVRPPR
jgi:hypothetical protein